MEKLTKKRMGYIYDCDTFNFVAGIIILSLFKVEDIIHGGENFNVL